MGTTDILGFDNYQDFHEHFSWDQRWSIFDAPQESFNIVHECIGRHLRSGRGRDAALRIVYSDGHYETYSFNELSVQVARFANLLGQLGIEQGEAVVVMLYPSLEYIVTIFGALKAGVVVVPSAPVMGVQYMMEHRVAPSQPRLIVIDDPSSVDRPQLGDRCELMARGDVLRLAAACGDTFDAHTNADTAAVRIYTSGTTGPPKEIPLSQRTFALHTLVMGKLIMNLQPDDRLLSISSPGWMGSFGFSACVPLSLGTAATLYSGRFDAAVVRKAMRDLDVNVFRAPPTAFRRLLAVDGSKPDPIDRLVYSGEALDQELAEAVRSSYGSYPRAHYGASEMGFVSIDYAFPDYEVRPTSLGKPLPGTQVAITDESGRELPVGKRGLIRARRHGAWRGTGDLGWLDEDGYLWYASRADDVIISAGYTIGPEEVEAALRLHEAVDEVAVVGVPDAGRGSAVAAFVKIAPGIAGDDGLRRELGEFARNRVGGHAYPRQVFFVEDFPRGEGGKIQRRKVREIFEAGGA